jgi:hypothetical protein
MLQVSKTGISGELALKLPYWGRCRHLDCGAPPSRSRHRPADIGARRVSGHEHRFMIRQNIDHVENDLPHTHAVFAANA